jgi:hypothetical protein
MFALDGLFCVWVTGEPGVGGALAVSPRGQEEGEEGLLRRLVKLMMSLDNESTYR